MPLNITVLSNVLPDTRPHPPQPASTFFTFFSPHCPLLGMINPRTMKWSTFTPVLPPSSHPPPNLLPSTPFHLLHTHSYTCTLSFCWPSSSSLQDIHCCSIVVMVCTTSCGHHGHRGSWSEQQVCRWWTWSYKWRHQYQANVTPQSQGPLTKTYNETCCFMNLLICVV